MCVGVCVCVCARICYICEGEEDPLCHTKIDANDTFCLKEKHYDRELSHNSCNCTEFPSGVRKKIKGNR